MKTKIFKTAGLSLASLVLLALTLFFGAMALSFGSLIFSPSKMVDKGSYSDFKQVSKKRVSLNVNGSSYIFDMENVNDEAYLAVVNKKDVELEVHDMKWRINILWSSILQSSTTLIKADAFSFCSMFEIRFRCFIITLFFLGVTWFLGMAYLESFKDIKSRIKRK
jgi:hypothetical protein